jgi:hypothetical protein
MMVSHICLVVPHAQPGHVQLACIAADHPYIMIAITHERGTARTACITTAFAND